MPVVSKSSIGVSCATSRAVSGAAVRRRAALSRRRSHTKVVCTARGAVSASMRSATRSISTWNSASSKGCGFGAGGCGVVERDEVREDVGPAELDAAEALRG